MSTKAGIIVKWLAKDIGFLVVPAFALAGVGRYLDNDETKCMTRYRDRSSLYGKPPPAEGEKYVPSWP